MAFVNIYPSSPTIFLWSPLILGSTHTRLFPWRKTIKFTLHSFFYWWNALIALVPACMKTDTIAMFSHFFSLIKREPKYRLQSILMLSWGNNGSRAPKQLNPIPQRDFFSEYRNSFINCGCVVTCYVLSWMNTTLTRWYFGAQYSFYGRYSTLNINFQEIDNVLSRHFACQQLNTQKAAPLCWLAVSNILACLYCLLSLLLQNPFVLILLINLNRFGGLCFLCLTEPLRPTCIV